MKRNLLVLIVMLFPLVSGCVSKIELNVRHAPELNLPGVRSLYVDMFSIKGEDSTTGFQLITLDDGNNPEFAMLVANKAGFSDVLARDGYFQLKGKEAADALISGSIEYKVQDSGYRIKKANMYMLTRSAAVTINFSVTTRDGTQLGAASVGSEVAIESSAIDKSSAKDANQPWHKVVEQAIIKAHPLMMQKIAPYVAKETRKLEDGESQMIQSGNAAAEKKNWAEATRIWNGALANGTPNERKAATWNLAVLDELEGRLVEALARYESLAVDGAADKYAKEAERLRSRITEQEKLRQIDLERKT